MTTIKIKRGLKSALPTLQSGELAFATDSQEVFIGTPAAKNLRVNSTTSQSNPNLFPNGNFQTTNKMEKEGNISYALNESGYSYGYYFKSNKNTMTLTPPDAFYSGLLVIGPDMVAKRPELRYRIQTPRLLGATSQLGYLSTLTVTLSFSYVSMESIPIQFQCGMTDNLNSFTLPVSSGENKFYTTFFIPSTNLVATGVYDFDLTIFKAISDITKLFKIGDLKLEIGTEPTPFKSNPVDADYIVLRNQYDVYATTTRASKVTPTTLEFYGCLPRKNEYKRIIYSIVGEPVLYGLDGSIKDTSGGAWTVYSSGLNSNPGIRYTSPTNHGMTDAVAYFQVSTDLRPN